MQQHCPFCGLVAGFHRDEKWYGYPGHRTTRAWVWYWQRFMCLPVEPFPID